MSARDCRVNFSRTARRLMQSTAYYPTDVFDILEDRTGIAIQNHGAGVVAHEE
jgi:hypothetical protein